MSLMRLRNFIDLFWNCSRVMFRGFGPKLSSDQTFQTEITSDQTFQTKMISDQTFQTKMRSKRPLIRLKCARNGLWSDSSALETSPDQTEPRPWSRLKRLWSDLPDRIDLWPNRTQTMVQNKKTMIRPSRPNWSLIRPNPDHGPD